MLGATALEGGLQLAGNLMNNLFANRRAKKQYKYDKKLMEQQNQYNIDMWNMQNAYNTPAAQMDRYMEAGLNPNLLYGNIDSGNASSAPEQQVARYQAPEHEVKGLQNIASTFLQERNLQRQDKLSEAQINLLRQQTISESMSQTSRVIDDFNKQLESYKRSGEMKLFWDTYEDKKRAIGLQNDNLIAQRELTMSTKDKLDTENQIGKYNLEVQLPLQSEQLRRQIRKIENENVYQKLMNLDMNEKVKYSARKYGLELDQAQELINKAKEDVARLKRENELSDAEAIIAYINTLPVYDVEGIANAKRALKGLLETYFDISLGF